MPCHTFKAKCVAFYTYLLYVVTKHECHPSFAKKKFKFMSVLINPFVGGQKLSPTWPTNCENAQLIKMKYMLEV